MKCQSKKCHHPATLHITEVLGDEQFEELHLCEQHANEYLYEPPAPGPNPMTAKTEAGVELDEGRFQQLECLHCGIKFVEFRNTGRLGCPNDYREFREELTPLLENVHGETRHCGKTPRRQSQTRQTQSELIQLRNKLKLAIDAEHYEEAARLRDQIRILEGS